MIFSARWAYRTSTKTATSFTPFRIVHGVESVLPIECQIPSLLLAVELLPDTLPLEERLLQLEQTIEDRRAALQPLKQQKHDQRPIMTPMSTLAPLAKEIWF